jgi:hypothetical protein
MTEKKKRTARIVLEVVGGLLFGVVALGGLGIYFLSTGPVNAPALTPTIETELNPEGSPYRVSVGETRIVWGGWDRPLDIVAANVTVREADRENDTPGPTVAVLPEVSVGVSFRALLGGDVRLTGLEILNPAVTLVRDPIDGISIAFDTALDDEPTGEAPRIDIVQVDGDDGGLIPRPVIEALTASLDPSSLFGGLERFSILQAEIQIVDRALGETLWLHNAALSVDRTEQGLDAKLIGTLETPRESTLVGILVSATPDQERIDATVTFDELDTDLPVRYFPDLVFYLPDLTIGGSFGATFDLSGDPRRFMAELTSAAGDVDIFAEVDGFLPAMTLRADFTDFDATIWLGGLQDAETALEYVPSTPFSGRVDLVLDVDGAPQTALVDMVSDVGGLTVDLERARDHDGFDLRAQVAALRPEAIARTAPALFDLDAFDVALNATVTAALDGDFKPLSGDLNATLGPGMITVPGTETVLPPLNGGSVAVRLLGPDGPVVVDDVVIDMDGVEISLAGSLRDEDGTAFVELSALATDLPIPRIREFWPASLAPNPRAWVTENITAGLVPQADLTLRARLPDGDPERMEIDTLEGGIRIEGATTHYLRPLPPATDISGVAEFAGTDFNIFVESATLEDATLRSGTVMISEVGQELEWIDIALDIDAPLPTALAILDTEPRSYITKIGLDAGAIQGSAAAQVQFRFPLLNDLTGDRIEYFTQATLRDLVVPRPEIKGTVTADTAVLDLSPGRMTLDGDIRIDGTPARVTWLENFDGDTDELRRLTVTSVADISESNRFDLDLSDYATGAAGVAATYSEFASGAQTLVLSANLSEAALDIGEFNWRKEPGTPSDLTMVLTLTPDGRARIDDFVLDGGAHHRIAGAVTAPASFDTVDTARIDAFRFGRTDVTGSVNRVDGVYEIDLRGPRFDAEPFLADDEDASEASLDAPEILEPRLRVRGAFDELSDGPTKSVSNAVLDLAVSGERVDSLELTGTVGDADRLEVRYTPTPSGGRDLLVTAEDTGFALEVAEITGRMEGGTLVLRGNRVAPDAPMTGRLELRDFTIREAPRLLKILELISVANIASALNSEGLAFDTLFADFVMDAETIEIVDATARGASIGITVSGTVDRETDDLNLGGTVAVSDIFSRTIGQLPLIDLIIGDGLIGATFQMTGPAGDPSVGVNPLSVLTPGFLNRVFAGPGAAPDEAQQDQQPSQRPEGN